MPTYSNRQNYIVQEFGVSVRGEDSIETNLILTEAILTFADSSGYTIGEEVTEATSSVTGNVYWNDGTRIGIISASDEFTGGETITGGSSSTVKTPTDVLNLLNRTADTPLRQRLLHTHTLTSTGSSDPQSAAIDANTRWVCVVAGSSANLTLSSGSATYPQFAVPAGKTALIQNMHEASTFVVGFSAADTCLVYELDLENPYYCE